MERDRTLFEHRMQPTVIEPRLAMVRPMADLGLFLAEMAAARSSGWTRGLEWMGANDGFRRRVLDQLRDSGPLIIARYPRHERRALAVVRLDARPQRHPDAGVPARPRRGRGRRARGRERVWDLAERIYPADIPVVAAEEARTIREERWLRALGIARPKLVGEAGRTGRDRGHVRRLASRPGGDRRGLRRAHRAAVTVRPPHPRSSSSRATCSTSTTCSRCTSRRTSAAGASSPCRSSTATGSSARSTPAADREADVLQVNAIHEDVPFDARHAGVEAELAALASWLGLERVGRA